MTAAPYRIVSACRVCGSSSLDLVLSLGRTPLANRFVSPGSTEPEPTYPLELLVCGQCGLAQLGVVVDPRLLFSDYLYSSSASAPIVEHFAELAAGAVHRFALAGRPVVEIGSNDGPLLAALRAQGARPLGIEPARNLALAANDRGLDTWNAFFDAAIARRVANERGPAAAVFANNVLAHIDDLHGVVQALDVVLAPDGVFIAEFPYVADLLDHVEYDTIYHEHLSYLAVAPLDTLLAGTGLEVFDIERIPTHGGSLRIFGGRSGRYAQTERVADLRRWERERRIAGRDAFDRLAEKVARSREALLGLLGRFRTERLRVAGYGATAKGNTLLNYCGIGPSFVEFIADTTRAKQGLLTPGSHIPVRPESALMEERPDRTLLLAWNYAEAVLRRHASYVQAGGRFIHPIPLAREIP